MSNEPQQYSLQPELNLISLAEAAQRYGLAHGYLRRLIREQKIWGRKIGRNWVTTDEAVKAYLATERRPGPK
jgi:excisionase family DNA binding protein